MKYEKDYSTFGGRLRIAREEAGITLARAMIWLDTEMPPPYRVSQSTLQRLEAGDIVEEDADPILVGALAGYYGVPVRHLSRTMEARIEHVTGYARQGVLVGASGVEEEALANPKSTLSAVSSLPDESARTGGYAPISNDLLKRVSSLLVVSVAPVDERPIVPAQVAVAPAGLTLTMLDRRRAA